MEKCSIIKMHLRLTKTSEISHPGIQSQNKIKLQCILKFNSLISRVVFQETSREIVVVIILMVLEIAMIVTDQTEEPNNGVTGTTKM